MVEARPKWLAVEAEWGGEIQSASLADRAEVTMLQMVAAGHPVIQMPVSHHFPPGLYVRQITIPKGTLLTSREHLHRHPFFISEGDISVTSETEGVVRYVAPFAGITEAGTRRVLFAHETTVWTTVHANPTNETDPDKIVLEITGHDNPLVDPSCPLLEAWGKDFSADRALEQATAPTITAKNP